MADLFLPAIAVGLALSISKWFQWYGTTQADRPLVAVTILGILLGRPAEGAMMAAALELVFMGTTQMGGTIPQEYTIGSIFGAAFALILGESPEVAITLAIPISMLGIFLYNVMKTYFTALVEKFDAALAENDVNKFKRLWLQFPIIYAVYYFLIGFVGIMIGTNAIQAILDAIPEFIMTGLTVAAGMLPAIGFALLLKSLWDKNLALFYFVGFGMAAFMGLTIIEISFFSICMAIYIGLSDYNNLQKPATAGAAVVVDDEEDFFDE